MARAVSSPSFANAFSNAISNAKSNIKNVYAAEDEKATAKRMIPQDDYTSYATLPSDGDGFSWNGKDYIAGEVVNTTGWDPDQVKSFRDQSGSEYWADNINDQFAQYSLDNLGGMEQYDFQWGGTRDQWAAMMASPEMNRWYKGYGIGEGDLDAGVALYNYYSGAEHDAEGNPYGGTGINNMAEVDPYNVYSDLENIVGTTQEGLHGFNKGYLEDAEMTEDGGHILDGKQSSEVDELMVNQQDLKAMQGFIASAEEQGALGDKDGDGEFNQAEKNRSDTFFEEFAPFMNPTMRDLVELPEEAFYTRELGQVYGEPTMDPDIRPRDMFSYEDLNRIGANAGIIPEYDFDGDAIPAYAVSSPNRKSSRFDYTEGALDDPYGEPTAESFDSALSLLGNDVQYTPLVTLDEEGGAYLAPDPTGELEYAKANAPVDKSQANVIGPDGAPLNVVGEDGKYTGYESLFGFGDAIPDSQWNNVSPLDDAFIEEEMQQGGIFDEPIVPGGTPISLLSQGYDPVTGEITKEPWTAADYRVYATVARDTSFLGEPAVVSRVEEARADREAGIDRDAYSYGTSLGSAMYPITSAVQYAAERPGQFGIGGWQDQPNAGMSPKQYYSDLRNDQSGGFSLPEDLHRFAGKGNGMSPYEYYPDIKNDQARYELSEEEYNRLMAGLTN